MVGLGVSSGMLGPTFPLTPGQACLPGFGVPLVPWWAFRCGILPQPRLALPGLRHSICSIFYMGTGGEPDKAAEMDHGPHQAPRV